MEINESRQLTNIANYLKAHGIVVNTKKEIEEHLIGFTLPFIAKDPEDFTVKELALMTKRRKEIDEMLIGGGYFSGRSRVAYLGKKMLSHRPYSQTHTERMFPSYGRKRRRHRQVADYGRENKERSASPGTSLSQFVTLSLCR